jgi:molybdate transport system ATP-binding protein
LTDGPGLEVALRHRLGAFLLDVAFAAPAGVTALFGPSGAGKTTVAHAIAGLLRPEIGRIVVGGEVLVDTTAGRFVSRHRRRIGYVFQEGRLFPHLSVRGNLRFGRWFAPRASSGPTEEHIVELLGIARLLDRRPAALSGGEKQRVAIGRALLANPRLLVMDEPLAALDETRKQEILPYLERLRDEVRVPIVYVSHAVPEVARLATTVVALADGAVRRSGTVAEVLSDADVFPGADREEAGAVLAGTLVGRAADGLSSVAFSGGILLVPGIDAALGAVLQVRVRARDVIIALERPSGISALNILDATVAGLGRADGPMVEVTLAVGADRLVARITRRSLAALGLAPGKRCFALVKSVAVGRRDLGVFAERDG